MPTIFAAQKTDLEGSNLATEMSNMEMASDVLKGLTAKNKYIPSKYFYDARGSDLFEQICSLPEYYLTRAEMSLLKQFADIMARGFANSDLVELGSGANWKIRTLLDAIDISRRSSIRYVPVDVSETALISASKELVRLYPELAVKPVIADFTKGLDRIPSDRTKYVLFFGSTIGNLNEDEAHSFLRSVARILRSGDKFFLGLDMVKSIQIMEAAYNDSQNVTAEFNRNILLVINRGLAADFDPNDFDHRAFFNERKLRVEMHLQAKRNVTIFLDAIGISVSIRKDETIRTEICRKFTRKGVEEMAHKAGLHVSEWYSDSGNSFAIAEITRFQG
jgi:L-histidine N-alpha-methyltransferase